MSGKTHSKTNTHTHTSTEESRRKAFRAIIKMVMNKTSSINGQFGSNNNNNNGPATNNNTGHHLISNAKNSVNGHHPFYSHDAQRIEQYKVSVCRFA